MKKLLLLRPKRAILERAFLALLFAGLLFLSPVQGQKIWDRGGNNNNWSDAANWNPDGVPTAADDVIIPNNFTVVVNIPSVCASLLLQSGADNTTLNINNGESLTVSGAIVLEAPTANGKRKRVNVNNGTLSCGSITMADTDSGNRVCDVRITDGTVTVSSDIVMNGAADENAMWFNSGGGGTLNIGGSMSGGEFHHTDESTVNFNGTVSQTVRGDTYGNLTFSGGGPKTLTGPATVTRTCTFDNGIVYTTADNLLSISNNELSIAAGASDASFVDGPVKKTGKYAFTFPVGRAGLGYAPIRISAPSGTNTAFQAEYFRAAPPDPTTLAAGIDHISAIEYWTLDRINGNSDVFVTLSWRSSSAVTDLSTLLVARYDTAQAQWVNEGQIGTTGTPAAGTITTAAAVTSFSPFTLGSSAALPANPLPIELVSFSGQVVDNSIELYWRTATELDNDYMAVERSADGIKFEEIGRVKGSGTTQEPQQYSLTDERPLYGINYYRLRQVDFDGAYEYHAPISVLFSPTGQAVGVSVYPNPTNEILHVSWQPSDEQTATLRVLDLTGRPVGQYEVPAGSGAFETPVHRLPAGLYVLEIRQSGKTEAVMFRKE